MALKKDPFIKQAQELSVSNKSKLTGESKVALIRKGNMLFNEGKIEEAKKIFLLVSYSDGLTRIGDDYYKKKNLIDAMRFYILAKNQKDADKVSRELSFVIRKWLKE